MDVFYPPKIKEKQARLTAYQTSLQFGAEKPGLRRNLILNFLLLPLLEISFL
jgi:hypothetical protein